MKRIFLTLAISLMLLLTLAISVCAAEYTVSSDEEYTVAYGQATSGDTIVITKKLTCDIYANKSVTYILKADWESSKLVINQSNVEVSFIADGGNYKIMPTGYSETDGWMNVSEIYENIVINLGGMNGGTLTIDGSNATHDRVSYVPALVENTTYYANVFPDICLNLLSGSAIANFNTTTKDDNVNACILYAKTVNMYDGAEIYANSVISAPLIKSCFFNLYGGEIFGNLLTSIRMNVNGVGFIYADRQFAMYDGRIYDNIFNATGGPTQFNVVGFISTGQGYYGAKAVVYGGELGDRYASGTGEREISAIVGVYVKDNGATPFYYNTGVTAGTRYLFKDTPKLAFDQNTGKTIWKVSNFELNSQNNYGFCWNHSKKPGDVAAVFLNAQKKAIAGNNFDTYTVINAYINGVYAHSGSSTTIAMPSGYTLWSTDGNKYCHTGKAYTLDEVKAAQAITLYSAYNAERVTIDGITRCSGCQMRYTCNDPEHDLQAVSVSYDDYTKDGVKVLKCNTCGLEKATEVSVPPIFTCLGYSVGPDGYSLKAGFKIDIDAITEYKEFNSAFSFGVVVANANTVESKEAFFVNGLINSSAKGVMIGVEDLKYGILNVDIGGFNASISDSLELVVGVYASNGDDEISMIQYEDSSKYATIKTYSDRSLNAVTFNQVRVGHGMNALVPQSAPVSNEE